MLMRRRRLGTPARMTIGAGVRAAVQRKRLPLGLPQDAVQANDDDVIGLRIVALARFKNDERPVEAASQLRVLVPVRVIDERARSRRCEFRDERLPGVDRRRDIAGLSAEAGHAIVITFELDAMPMNRRRLRHSVDERDLHRFAARQYHHGTGNRTRIETRRVDAFQIDPVAALVAITIGLLAHHHAKAFVVRGHPMTAILLVSRHLNPEHQSRHSPRAVVGPVAGVGAVGQADSCRMCGHVAVKQPIAWTFGCP